MNDLLQGLASESWQKVRDSIQQIEALVAGRSLVPSLALVAVKAVSALASHEKWEVRAAVARAAEHFDRDTAVEVLSELAEDDNAFVQSAARPLLARRASALHADFLREEHEDLFAKWLGKVEKKHGARAREAARQVAVRFTELNVRQLHHELVRALAPADLALDNIKLALRHGIDDRAAFLELVTAAQARLDFVKRIIESTGKLVQEVPVSFRSESVLTTIEEATHVVEAKWRATHDRPVRVEVAIDRELAFQVDRPTIVQAFANVLENGFESYGDGASVALVAVAAKVVEGRIAISFSDQGRGMDEATVRDACRLGSTRKPGGIGCGLALTKKFVESVHGGMLQLTSKLGHGTTVTAILPRQQSGGRRLDLE